MLDAIGKIVLLSDFIDLLRRLARFISGLRSREEKERVAKALRTILSATSATRAFISNHGYVRSEALEQLWLDAMEQVVAARIGEHLPDYLVHKAKFWGQPQDWIDNPTSLKLIPRLNEIDEECEALLLLLK